MPPMTSDLSRRDFLASSAAATAVAAGIGGNALSAGAAPVEDVRPLWTTLTQGSPAMIHLFMPGGWPQFDLWDPKPFTPLTPGVSESLSATPSPAMRAADLLSTCPAIASAAPGVFLGAGLELLGTMMDRGVILRSLTVQKEDSRRFTDTRLDHREHQQRMLDALTFDEPFTELTPDPTQSYGLAQALLKATKLVEAGQRFVRVTTPFEAYQGFDAHEFGARAVAAMKKNISIVLFAIVGQMEATGLLDRTVLVVSSEFGRSPVGCSSPTNEHGEPEPLILDERGYGHHAHFATTSMLFFGGPFRRGGYVGRTADSHPMIAEQPVLLPDVHATIASAMGFKLRMGGRVVRELLA